MQKLSNEHPIYKAIHKHTIDIQNLCSKAHSTIRSTTVKTTSYKSSSKRNLRVCWYENNKNYFSLLDKKRKLANLRMAFILKIVLNN